MAIAPDRPAKWPEKPNALPGSLRKGVIGCWLRPVPASGGDLITQFAAHDGLRHRNANAENRSDHDWEKLSGNATSAVNIF